MKRIFSLAVCLIGMSVVAGTYTTTFQYPENPLSDGRVWLNGKHPGTNWTDMAVTNFGALHYAYGLQPGSGGYDDAIAVMTNLGWGTTQEITMRIFTTNTPAYAANAFEELEYGFGIMTNGGWWGYFFDAGIFSDSGYVEGGLNAEGKVYPAGWSNLTGTNFYGAQYKLTNGSTIRCAITNKVITIYFNGQLVNWFRDDTGTGPTSYMPLIGAFHSTPGSNTDYGFSYFSATDFQPSSWTTTNLLSWTPGVTVGVQGGIPTYRTNMIIDVTQAPYSADKTGAADCTTAIQNAINAATSNTVVYLPAGTYKCTGVLQMQYNVGVKFPVPITIRGAGSNTVINASPQGGYFILAGSGQDYNWPNPASGNTIVAGGFVKGSSNVTVTTTAGLIPGALAKIFITDSTNQLASPVTLHVSGYRDNRAQQVLITATNATQVTFWPPLYSDYGGMSGRICCAQYQANLCGIEDLTIDLTSAGDSTVAIQYEQAVNCWIKNVNVRHCHSYVLFVWDSVFNEVRHCWVDQTIHVGNNGAGLKVNDTSGLLAEDNIIAQNFPGIEVNSGSSGNVFGYNFVWDTYQTQSGAAIDSNHGPHNSFNLYEGNETPYFQADGYFGSVSDDTLFRNWLHEIQPETVATNGYYLAMSLNRFTRNYNVIGNLIGTNGVHAIDLRFGDPNIGNWSNNGNNAPPWADWAAMLSAAPGAGPGQAAWQELDTNVWSSTLMLGNYYYRTNGVGESLGTYTLPASLYFAAKPSWFGTNTFPPFDSGTTNINLTQIPAGARYFSESSSGAPPPSSGGTVRGGSGIMGGNGRF